MDMSKVKRVVTLCDGGNVRSVTLAAMLKMRDYDALVGSLQFNTENTLKMLYDWADLILVVDENMAIRVNHNYRHKVLLANIGEDIWKRSLDPDLMILCETILSEMNLERCDVKDEEV